MKKCLSLLAILGLLFSMGLVSQVLANAPVYPEVPSVKLYTNGIGLTPAFDLAQFNTAPDAFFGDTAASYAVTQSFLGLDSLSASSFSGAASNVNQAGYSAATDGPNTFGMLNGGSASTTSVSNKTKFSTYKIDKLGKVGLTAGSSYTVTPSVSNASGPATAPSFGNPAAIVVSDTTKVTAAWDATSTKVVITSIAASATPVTVDVIASPVSGASTYTGVGDQDKERVWVYSNLLSNGTFSTAADTAAYAIQASPNASKTDQGTQAWVSADTDSNNVVATGVYQFILTGTSGLKLTPILANWIPMQADTWYTVRAHLKSSAAVAGSQFNLFLFNQTLASGAAGDVSGHILVLDNGIPTTWTWLNSPLYVHTAATGLPQIVINSGGAQTVDLDELQVIQAPPNLFDISEGNARGNVRDFYRGGLFGYSNSTALWGPQTAPGAAGYQDSLTYTSDTLIGSSINVGFTGASGSNQEGFKWTASTTGTGAGLIAIPATIGYQAGAQMSLNVASGTMSNLEFILVAALGVDGGGNEDEVIAAGEVGKVAPGTIYTAGNAFSSGYQLQFVVRANEVGALNVSNVDFDSDANDDPNFGDGNLFP